MRGQRQEKNDHKKEAHTTFHFSYDISELHTFGMFFGGRGGGGGGGGGQVRRGKNLLERHFSYAVTFSALLQSFLLTQKVIRILGPLAEKAGGTTRRV